MTLKDQVVDAYRERYGVEPEIVVFAPGRVNLIGEHTDYNDGFVLPMAIDRSVVIALGPRDDEIVKIHPLDFDEIIEFDVNQFSKFSPSPAEYVKGVTWALQEAGYSLKGWEGVMKGDIPIGAGLSSSAGLELAITRAFSVISGFDWDAEEMALLSQKAENEWLGVKCGIMDQLISASGQAGSAILIDCRTLERTPAPLPDGTVVVVLDTNTRRGLVDGEYNIRRAQCEAAAAYFNVPKLRDVTLERFNAEGGGLDEVTFRRARHVITENARTLRAQAVMAQGDASAMGELMVQSHESMRDDFEISTDALNAIVEASREHPACYGARMTGGGFGGCGCALIKASDADDFVAYVTKRYHELTGFDATLYICQPSAGAGVLKG
jgi:galactokinase